MPRDGAENMHGDADLLLIVKPEYDPSCEYEDAGRHRLRHYDLPALFEAEFEVLAKNLGWSLSENSSRVYLGALRNYWAFCARNLLDRYDFKSVAHFLLTIGYPRIQYLESMTAGGAAAARGHEPGVGKSTLHTYLAAIEKSFRNVNRPGPAETPVFKEWLRGFYRRLAQPKDRKDGILREDLRRAVLLARSQTNKLAAARDAAILLLGFSCALRRSELAIVKTSDIRHVVDGWILRIPRSKTDQAGEGVDIPIYPANDMEFDVISAITQWKAQSGIQSGPLFRRIRGAAIGSEPLTAESISQLIKKFGGPGNIAGHSLRVGFMTQGGLDSKEVSTLKVISRHKSTEMAEDYVRRVNARKQGPGTLL